MRLTSSTPETFKGKVFYQIFPDRFCEGVENKPMPFPDRLYQADKHAEPFWQPNETGGHLNEDYFGGDLRGHPASSCPTCTRWAWITST